MAGCLSSPGAVRRLTAAVVLVDGRPGSPFGLFFCHAALFVAFGDVLGLAFLLVGVLGLVCQRACVRLLVLQSNEAGGFSLRAACSPAAGILRGAIAKRGPANS